MENHKKQQISKDTITEAMSECGSMEKVHRKYSTFYATLSLTVDEDVLKWYPSLEPLLGYHLQRMGIWSDEGGFDLRGDIDFSKITKYIEHPEEVIVKPAWKEPVWESVEPPVELI